MMQANTAAPARIPFNISFATARFLTFTSNNRHGKSETKRVTRQIRKPDIQHTQGRQPTPLTGASHPSQGSASHPSQGSASHPSQGSVFWGLIRLSPERLPLLGEKLPLSGEMKNRHHPSLP